MAPSLPTVYIGAGPVDFVWVVSAGCVRGGGAVLARTGWLVRQGRLVVALSCRPGHSPGDRRTSIQPPRFSSSLGGSPVLFRRKCNRGRILRRNRGCLVAKRRIISDMVDSLGRRIRRHITYADRLLYGVHCKIRGESSVNTLRCMRKEVTRRSGSNSAFWVYVAFRAVVGIR